MVSGDDLRLAMSKFPTGVTLVTTVAADGSVHAMTANSLTSVSLDPPLVLVCIGHARHTNQIVRRTERYAVNVLNGEQATAAKYYSQDDDDRVGAPPVEFTLNERGVPKADGCICFLDCDVVAAHDHGDHTIFVGRLREADTGEGQPLIFHDRHLRELGSD